MKFISNFNELLTCAICITAQPALPNPICISQCAANYGPKIFKETINFSLFILRSISKVCSVQKDDKECGIVVNDCLEGIINIPMKKCNPLRG